MKEGLCPARCVRVPYARGSRAPRGVCRMGMRNLRGAQPRVTSQVPAVAAAGEPGAQCLLQRRQEPSDVVCTNWELESGAGAGRLLWALPCGLHCLHC